MVREVHLNAAFVQHSGAVLRTAALQLPVWLSSHFLLTAQRRAFSLVILS